MKNTNNLVVFVISAFACLVFINLIGLNKFWRIDLTSDKKYTLSKASKETVENLSDMVTVSAYFTEGLPPPYAQNSRYVNDLLEEYLAAAKGKFAFEFLDPTKAETTQDKEKKKNKQKNIFGQIVREATSVENELGNLGLQPVEIRVIEDDQQQTKRAYMGIVIRYQEKHEVIPVVQNLADLEINITSLIKKLSRTKHSSIGLIKNKNYAGRIDSFTNLLSKDITIKEIDLATQEVIEPDIDALIVLGAGDHFGADGAAKIENYLALGKSASFFMDRFNIDARSFTASAEGPKSSTYSIINLLTKYGIEIPANLVADAACASLNMQEERSGFTFNVPVKYPFIPEIKNLSFESQITKGLSGLIFPFASALKITPKDNLKIDVLASTSKVSWLEVEPLDINPRRNWSELDISPSGPHPVLVQAIGKLLPSAPESRLVVAGSSVFLWNEFATEANQTIGLNIVDWMLADSSLLSMRARSFLDVPLDADISDTKRQTVKYGNILGVPFLLALYGLIRWRLRESYRKSLKA